MGLALAVEMGQGSRAGVGRWGFACGVLAHGQHNQLVVVEVEEDQQKNRKRGFARCCQRAAHCAAWGRAL